MLSYEEVATKVNSNKPIENFKSVFVAQKMNEIKEEKHDKRQLLNGHHISLILVEYMKRLGKHTNTYNHDSVGRDIRMGYTVAEFHKTELYSNLMAFQNSNGITFLK